MHNLQWAPAGTGKRNNVRPSATPRRRAWWTENAEDVDESKWKRAKMWCSILGKVRTEGLWSAYDHRGATMVDIVLNIVERKPVNWSSILLQHAESNALSPPPAPCSWSASSHTWVLLSNLLPFSLVHWAGFPEVDCTSLSCRPTLSTPRGRACFPFVYYSCE